MAPPTAALALPLVLLLAVAALALASPPAARAVVTIPLYGNFSQFFFYYTVVTLGANQLPFTVIVDTGSSDLLVPSSACKACPGRRALFWNCSESASCAPLGCNATLNCTSCEHGVCGFEMNYVGLSESALAYRDVARLGPLNATVDFGAVYALNTTTTTTAATALPLRLRRGGASPRLAAGFYPEGVLGLAYEAASALGAPPVLDALVAAGEVADVFSMCLTQSGGALTLGGVMPWLAAPPAYTPIVRPFFYGVALSALLVGSVPLPVPASVFNSGDVIVDSGTPPLVLPPLAFAALKALFLSNCTNSHLPGICTRLPRHNRTLFDGYCVPMAPADVAAFPTLRLQLPLWPHGAGSFTVALPPALYVAPQPGCSPGTFGLSLSQEEGFTVLGAALMQGYVTVFDRANARVGFAPVAGCPSHSAHDISYETEAA